jgi:hypothetical protein
MPDRFAFADAFQQLTNANATGGAPAPVVRARDPYAEAAEMHEQMLRAMEQLQMEQLRARPPVMYDPSSNLVRVRPLAPYQALSATPSARPPAKAPSATTTIGAAEPIDADYAALVAELGVNSAAVDLERFKALVPALGLHVYDRAQVTEYLHCQYKVPPSDLTPVVLWGWRPLREKDRIGASMIGFNGRVQPGAPLYSKPIPYPVLLTVKAIVDACPSATFFVSDELQGERIPDPFLLVRVAGEEFVVERWDEPAFRAKG